MPPSRSPRAGLIDVTVLTSGHDVADARLHRLTAAMARAGLQVEVLGLGSVTDAPGSAVEVRTTSRRGPVGRARLAMSYAVAARGRVLVALDPDSLLTATAVGAVRDRGVVADVHEDYAALLADRPWAHGLAGRTAASLAALATAVARRSDLTFVADEHVPPLTAPHRTVVRNLADLSFLPSADQMVPAATPTAAYIGDLRASRGLFAMLEAIARAPRWHLDLVGPVAAGDQERLHEILAADPGLAARVRLHDRLPPAKAWQHVREAWVGLSLLSDTPAFRDAMPSKVHEYLAAGLPVITTNLPKPATAVNQAAAGAVVETGTDQDVGAAVAAVLCDWDTIPQTYERVRAAAGLAAAGLAAQPNPYDDAAAAIAALVADPGVDMDQSPARRMKSLAKRGLRAALAPNSPVRKAIPAGAKEPLRALRRRLPDKVAAVADKAAAPTGAPVSYDLPDRPVIPTQGTRLLVAPANFAGQGDAWARAVNAHLPGVHAWSMMKDNKFGFPVDYEVPDAAYQDRAWQLEQRLWTFENFTHVLVEAERPVFGPLYGPSAVGDVAQLRKAGLTVATICHGSDIRQPSAHAARFPHSPFDDATDRTNVIMEARTKANIAFLESFEGLKFVSTPDLLDYVPSARWCPVVVEPDLWVSDVPLLEREVPKVVHIPSSGRMKGSELIDPIMTDLAQAGLIDYVSVRDLSHDELRAVYQDADIVLDQFVLGLYGVAAAEAMAAGRVVVAYVTEPVRQRVREATGREVPIMEADPETLRAVIEGILADRAAAIEFASAGPEFVREVHDGRLSAKVLSAIFD